MKYLGEEIVTETCTVGKLVKSQLKWTGHMIRMKGERLPKRSETKEVAENEEDHS